MLINIENVKPGMKLIEDVLLPSGAILVNESQILTPSLIEIIIKRGIQKIQVVPQETTVQSEHEKIVPVENKNADSVKPQTAKENAAPETSQSKIKVFPSQDKMLARLCVEPSGTENELLAKEDILVALAEAGIVFGIDDKAIDGIVEKWLKLKRYYEVDGIAKGAAPVPAKEGCWDIKVSHISDVEFLTAARKVHYFWELKAAGIDAERVDPDMVIAVKQDDVPAVPGKNIKGEEILTDEIIKATLNLEKTVRYSVDNKKILPVITGIAYSINAALGVCPIDFDGSVDISISPDIMKAEMIFHPPGTRGNHPSIAQVEALLKKNGIVYGVMENEIKDALLKCSQGVYPDQPVIVAAGTPPLNGENGKVEFLFNIETSLKPKINPNGSVDYKNVELVVSATKGQELARLKAPTKGIPGTDILGHKTPAVDGTPAKLPVGTNTAQSPGNSDILIAATDGNVKYNGTSVEINEGFFIKGNVDFSTGNIKYAKSVVVGGDIGGGFIIECGGDLQVAGTIEDSRIIAGGNVLCKLGFIGQGKGCIDAKGDINLMFMKNQLVKSGKNVIIAKEAINCTVFARKTISVHGNPLSIIGGKMTARDCITAYSIGNSNGVKTTLEVGTDFVLVEDMQKTESQILEMSENKKKLLPACNKYEKLAELKHDPGGKEEALLVKLRATLAKYEQQLKALEERKKMIATNMNEFKNAVIKIEHAALPGTTFKIGQHMLVIKEEVVGPKTVRLVDEEIKIF
jgi:uncharacterized protein (DUF342 family)